MNGWTIAGLLLGVIMAYPAGVLAGARVERENARRKVTRFTNEITDMLREFLKGVPQEVNITIIDREGRVKGEITNKLDKEAKKDLH